MGLSERCDFADDRRLRRAGEKSTLILNEESYHPLTAGAIIKCFWIRCPAKPGDHPLEGEGSPPLFSTSGRPKGEPCLLFWFFGPSRRPSRIFEVAPLPSPLEVRQHSMPPEDHGGPWIRKVRIRVRGLRRTRVC